MLTALLVFLGIVGQAGVSARPAQSKVKAQALLSTGTSLYERGDVAGALDKFRAAFAAYPSPKLQFNLGQAYRDLGRPLEAREAFNHFVIEAADAPADMKAEARRALSDVESKLGRVQITSSPDDAEISVDGRVIGRSPIVAPIWLVPGDHQLLVRHADAGEGSYRFHVEAGRLVSLPIGLIPRKQSPVSEPTEPARTTAAPASPPKAMNALFLGARPTADSATTQTQYVGTAQATETSRSRTPLPRWLPWAGAAATIVLVTAAITMGVSSNNRYDELKSTCGQTALGCSSDQTGVVSSRDHTANVFWALAGTMAVATGVTAFVNTREGGISALWQF